MMIRWDAQHPLILQNPRVRLVGFDDHARLIDGPFEVTGIAVTPFYQHHGNIMSLGFRFGRIAYANDVVKLDDAAFAAMEGVDTLIIDAMRYTPHPTHAHLDLTLSWMCGGPARRARQ